MDFTGKVVAVTGAGSGIGRETALAFAARGARLAVWQNLCPEDHNSIRGLGQILAPVVVNAEADQGEAHDTKQAQE